MNTLDIINTVLSTFNHPIIVDMNSVKQEEKEPIVYTVKVDPKYIIYKDPKKELTINKEHKKIVYESPSISEKEEKIKHVETKKSNKKIVKKSVKSTKNK